MYVMSRARPWISSKGLVDIVAGEFVTLTLENEPSIFDGSFSKFILR